MGKKVVSITPSIAIKMCNQYNKEINALFEKEYRDNTYSYLTDEICEIPNYSIEETDRKLQILVNNVIQLKTALRKFNMSEKGSDSTYTLDELLVLLPILNKRKVSLERMSNASPRVRKTLQGGVVEYTCTNYNIEEAKENYKKLCDRIAEIQNNINNCNSTQVIQVQLEDC